MITGDSFPGAFNRIHALDTGLQAGLYFTFATEVKKPAIQAGFFDVMELRTSEHLAGKVRQS